MKEQWDRLRQYFPVTTNCIYLDHGSMSPLPTPVLHAVTEFQRRRHLYGRDFAAWWEKAEAVRAHIGRLVGAHADEIAFTGSTSQGINIVAQGLDWRPGDNVILNDLEFPANIYPWLNLERRGVEVRILKSVDGMVTVEDIEAAIDHRTRLLAISHVQASNGFRCNLAEVGELCRQRGVLFAVDATQSLGAFPVDVRACGIDFLFGATFKWLLAPDGLGFLYCRRDRLAQLQPAYLGWAGMRDRNNFDVYRVDLPEAARRFELGNLNFSAIYGLAAALDFIESIGIPAIAARLGELIAYLHRRLAEVPGVIIRSLFPLEHRGGLLTFDVPDRQGLALRLKAESIVVALRCHGIRISPHFYTTTAELDRLVDVVAQHVRR
ncbi:MAG: aminotransferase class V-fold PLP-dependent enzyme [Limnochordaceae bacterium]|nr:aminotransferase class V-fold PLP-dependent enzyme [Limnochordaceae bacterium]